ncbi:MAG: tetratricopeptide (TPR) repeat protein [Chlamydiales bacterium]|jgi:tetratricopeptide (TPR) repeat protein
MNFVHRLQIIYHSSIGKLLLAFFGVIVVLVFFYIVLRLRQKSVDALAYRYQSYFEKANKNLSSFIVAGRHKADLFGRQTVLKREEGGAYELSLVNSPDFIDDSSCERFRSYHRVIYTLSLPIFSHYTWTYDTDMLITVQKGFVKDDGRLLTTLKEYSLDKKIGQADAELILMEIARALAALHECKTGHGQSLYYGYLLPRSIHLSFDSNKRIERIVLSDHGIPFALGGKAFVKLIDSISKDTKHDFLEELVVKDILQDIHMLAPEQRDLERCHEVGPAADFFSFGALAVSLLSEKKFLSLNEIDWETVPPKWVPFLKDCLQDLVTARPKDFMELQDRLYDPDMALTINDNIDGCEEEFEEDEPISLGNLAKVLQASKAFQQQEEAVAIDPKEMSFFDKMLSAGNLALTRGKWATAKKFLEKAYEVDPEHAEVNVGMAIVFYEGGELKEAEGYYLTARDKDSIIAKRFREHIAFKV